MYVPSNIKTDYIFDFTQTFSFWTFHVQKLLRTVFVKILKRLSLSLNADLCIHSYWLSRLRQAGHRKMIQSSALRLRIWRFKILTCPLLKLRFLCGWRIFGLSNFHFLIFSSKVFNDFSWFMFMFWKRPNIWKYFYFQKPLFRLTNFRQGF